MSDSCDEYEDSGPPKNRLGPLTSIEKSTLLQLIRTKKGVVESKKTDIGTTGKKLKAWEEISQQFSSQPNCSMRTSKQIKTWWNNVKKRGKKAVTKHKREIRRTGGGQKPPDLPTETEEVMSIVPSQMTSLDNEFDCDEDMYVPAEFNESVDMTGDEHNFDDSANVTADLAEVEKTVKANRQKRDPRSSLVDFEYEEHQWRLKTLQVEYSTALKKRDLVQKQLDFADSANKLKLSILGRQSTESIETGTEV